MDKNRLAGGLLCVRIFRRFTPYRGRGNDYHNIISSGQRRFEEP
jgi:hypothetical protein